MPSIKFIPLLSPFFISLQVKLMLLGWVVHLAQKFTSLMNNFIRCQYSFGNAPASVKASELNLLPKQVGLHLHELFIDSHSSIHYYFSYLFKLLVFNIIVQSISDRIQDSFQDMLSFCIEVQPNNTPLNIRPPIRRKNAAK